VVAQAVEIARSYAPVLEAATAFISELDAFSSMAHLAVSAPGGYVCPTLTPAGSGDVRVIGGRHPVMEMQEGVTFIPNDYVMERDASRFQIVTGPNTGGKSTWIRTLGVLSVMAQMGCYVPAEAATLPIMDCICARVGAGDKAVKGVSTFMAEMLEAGSIMGIAGPASLVIVDELGRGTSTYDGFGLAWAISEHLAATTRCMTLFATHFHELTALAGTQAGVVNRHVSAHTTADSITMLFAVKEGPCPSSFGIHVAEMAAFPPSVVASAREKAAQLEASTGSASAYMMGAGAGAGAGIGAGAEGASDGKVAAAKRVAREIAGGGDAATAAAAFEALPLPAKRRRVGDLLAEA
jgi:DNA mismatch repair protein MSH2